MVVTWANQASSMLLATSPRKDCCQDVIAYKPNLDQANELQPLDSAVDSVGSKALFHRLATDVAYAALVVMSC